MIGTILCALAKFSWIAELGMVSIVLFGESPYPAEEDYE